MAALTYEGPDEVMGVPTTGRSGSAPTARAGARSWPGSTFGMVGSNGSAAYADIDSGVAVAVMRNRFNPHLSAAAAVDRSWPTPFPLLQPAQAHHR